MSSSACMNSLMSDATWLAFVPEYYMWMWLISWYCIHSSQGNPQRNTFNQINSTDELMVACSNSSFCWFFHSHPHMASQSYSRTIPCIIIHPPCTVCMSDAVLISICWWFVCVSQGNPQLNILRTNSSIEFSPTVACSIPSFLLVTVTVSDHCVLFFCYSSAIFPHSSFQWWVEVLCES